MSKNTQFIISLIVCAFVSVSVTKEVYRTDKDVVAVPVIQNIVGAVRGDDEEQTPLLAAITARFNQIESIEDRKTIHKLFFGASEYLSKCKALEGTYQFDPILGRVQSSYGWDRDKYPKFTDAVFNYLEEVDYLTPKPLKNKTDRFNFAKIFHNLAKATQYE